MLWQWMHPLWVFAAAKSSGRTGLPAGGRGAGGVLWASSARSIAYRSPLSDRRASAPVASRPP